MKTFDFLEVFTSPAIVTDINYTIVYFNKQALDHQIYGRAIVKNKKLIPDIIQTEEVDQQKLKRLSKKKPYTLNSIFAGSVSVQWNVTEIQSGEGVFFLFVDQTASTSVNAGNTEDKLAEAESNFFQVNRILLTRLLENIPGMIFRSKNNTERNLLLVSRSCKRLTGYTVKELTAPGKNEFSSLIHEDDRLSVTRAIKKSLSRHSFYRVQYRIIKKDGKIKWVQEQSHVKLDKHDKTEYLEGIITDINQMKLSEQALKFELDLNQAFAGISLDILKGYVNIDQTAGNIIDHALKFTGSNCAVIMLPYADTQRYRVYALDKSSCESHAVSYEVSNKVIESGLLQGCLNYGTAFIRNDLNFEGKIPGLFPKTYHIKRGMAVPAIFKNQCVAILFLANAEVDYDRHHLQIAERFLNVFALSIFKLKADESLRSEKEKAEESDKMKSLFLSNMSHDLRTPMNAIVGFADMLKESNLNVEEKDKFVEAIIRSGDNLLRLVNDIIDISKIEAGEFRLFMSECNLNQMIDDIEMSTIQAINRHHKQEVQFYSQKGVPGDTFMIRTDVTRLQQVLTNLAGNAVKFTDQGFIEVGYRIEQTKLLFFVRDSGIGISPEDQKLIFERFGQARDLDKRNKSGSGLGLTISKNLVELMGGTLWLDSWPGEGSTFWFTLPLLKPQNSAPQNQPVEATPLKGDLSGKTILVVEDVDTNYFYLSSLLTKLNCRVLRASNGRMAVEMGISDPSIDLILMDIELPVMNGYDATREIKASRPGLPIVAQTAFAMIGERERSKEAGCDDYMAKPIRKDQLIDMVLKFV